MNESQPMKVRITPKGVRMLRKAGPASLKDRINWHISQGLLWLSLQIDTMVIPRLARFSRRIGGKSIEMRKPLLADRWEDTVAYRKEQKRK